MKLSFKKIEDHFSDFGISSVQQMILKMNNIIENKIKIIHHDHAFKKNNILGFYM